MTASAGEHCWSGRSRMAPLVTIRYGMVSNGNDRLIRDVYTRFYIKKQSYKENTVQILIHGYPGISPADNRVSIEYKSKVEADHQSTQFSWTAEHLLVVSLFRSLYFRRFMVFSHISIKPALAALSGRLSRAAMALSAYSRARAWVFSTPSLL